jgi:histidinol dehydrogenase
MEGIVLNYSKQSNEIEERLGKRKRLFDSKIIISVQKIFDAVEEEGDKAIFNATRDFDKTELNEIIVPPSYIEQCVENLEDPLKVAIKKALENVIQVNNELLPESLWIKKIREGTEVGEKFTPFQSVGLWIPSRKGPLISTALMLIGAARVAGVKQIYVGIPPNREGLPDPVTVAASKLAGATDIFVGNGVGIIAGWSIGTASIKKVDGIFGPGPAGISAAMTLSNFYGVKTVTGIGPTDSAIYADGTGDIKILAWDLLNEAEHGGDSTSILVTTSEHTAISVAKEIGRIISNGELGREEILEKVFGKDGTGTVVLVDTIDAAVELINKFAPEHMMIKAAALNEKYMLEKIINCGEILIGEYTPFSAANYAVGITAVLPTNGFAKNISGITCRDMIKATTIGKLDRNALLEIRDTIKSLGEYEGLPYHVKASEIRFQQII